MCHQYELGEWLVLHSECQWDPSIHSCGVAEIGTMECQWDPDLHNCDVPEIGVVLSCD